jgi:hypothetical protein
VSVCGLWCVPLPPFVSHEFELTTGSADHTLRVWDVRRSGDKAFIGFFDATSASGVDRGAGAGSGGGGSSSGPVSAAGEPGRHLTRGAVLGIWPTTVAVLWLWLWLCCVVWLSYHRVGHGVLPRLCRGSAGPQRRRVFGGLLGRQLRAQASELWGRWPCACLDHPGPSEHGASSARRVCAVFGKGGGEVGAPHTPSPSDCSRFRLPSQSVHIDTGTRDLGGSCGLASLPTSPGDCLVFVPGADGAVRGYSARSGVRQCFLTGIMAGTRRAGGMVMSLRACSGSFVQQCARVCSERTQLNAAACLPV